MAFVFGRRSEAELRGVHPALVGVVRRALVLSPRDFMVFDGVRTLAEQRVMVASGASWTLASRHRVGADGFGHAVDLLPVVNGKPRWEWPLIYPIADAVRRAAVELSVPIRWGGFWGRLDTFGGSLERGVAAYVAARRAAKKAARIDGPHYELPAALFP